MHDLVTPSATLIDGTGGERRIADVAVDGEHITAVGRNDGPTGDLERVFGDINSKSLKGDFGVFGHRERDTTAARANVGPAVDMLGNWRLRPQFFERCCLLF